MSLGTSFASTLEAARTGAEWAWEAIYRDVAPAVLAYLRARRAIEPEDLVGEVFLQVVKNLSRFEGDEGDFHAWVFTIAHRRLVDDYRHRTLRPVDPSPDETIADAGPIQDAQERALQNLEIDDALRLIRRLSDDQQDVVLLRLLGGLTIEEVAEVVGKSPGAVKALQRRGLAALRKELSKLGVPL
jgi:RNA polymerase sigma factor (sigma-70 family)